MSRAAAPAVIDSADPGKQARAAAGIPVVPAYDAYRALAIFGVVLFHVIQVNGVLGAAGDSPAAVAMWGILPGGSLTALFIVSGFVMFLPVAVRNGDFGSRRVFGVRRAARLVPAYWLSLVIAMILLVTIGPGLPGIGPIAVHFGILQTPALFIDGPVSVNGVTVGDFPLGLDVIPPVWTLSVEVAFYIVLAFVATAYYRRPFVGLAICAAVLVAWHALATNAGDVASALGIDLSAATEARIDAYYASQLPSWGLALAAGMTGAWLYVRLRDRFAPDALARRALWALGATTVALALVMLWAGKEAVDDPNPFLGLFARQSLAISLLLPLAMGAVMLAFSLIPPGLQRPLANRPIRWFADISYSVYLIHFAVIWVAINELSLPFAPDSSSLGATLAWSALVFPVSTVYAWLSARFLERPIRRWARGYRPGARRRRTAVAAPGAGAAAGPAPAVSIVISTYNRADWVRGAIDSVLAQDYADLELVVVDDGSGDETPAVLAHYAERNSPRRFRHLRQENAGQAAALNRGNAAARGELIGYLSDDDLLKPDAVARLAAALAADPAAAVAYPGYLTIDAEGEVEDTVRPIEYSPIDALRLHETVIGPGALVRRGALERSGGWEPDLRYMGDLILWMKIGLEGGAIRVDEPLAYWRRHPGSATIQLGLEHAREHLRVFARGLELDGLPPVSGAVRAEGLRNACLTAALFGGQGDSWPGERFTMFDTHRMRISSASSGQGPSGPVDWDAAEQAALLYRELVTLTIEAARPRPGSGGAAAGYGAAMGLLRDAGAMARADGSFATPAGPRELRVALLEAAVACGAETDPETTRFLILDRERREVDQAELEELVRLGFGSSAAELADALARRRSALAEGAPDRVA